MKKLLKGLLRMLIGLAVFGGGCAVLESIIFLMKHVEVLQTIFFAFVLVFTPAAVLVMSYLIGSLILDGNHE